MARLGAHRLDLEGRDAEESGILFYGHDVEIKTRNKNPCLIYYQVEV